VFQFLQDEGVSPQIENLQNICYKTDIPDYEKNFDEQGIFYCPDIYTLPQEYIDIVEPQGIKSMLQCSIQDRGLFRGYVGFDECANNRLWTQEQIDVLTYFAEILSIFLLKQRAQDEVLRRLNSMASILDTHPDRIYVIDPDTCRLHFFNAAARQRDEGLVPGDICYKALMGRRERCEGCPAQNIRQKKVQECVLSGKVPGEQILAAATLVDWDGQDACLLTCRSLQEK
jgi:putative two-component system response regulator